MRSVRASLLEALADFVIHLIPAFLLLTLVVASFRWAWIGRGVHRACHRLCDDDGKGALRLDVTDLGSAGNCGSALLVELVLPRRAARTMTRPTGYGRAQRDGRRAAAPPTFRSGFPAKAAKRHPRLVSGLTVHCVAAIASARDGDGAFLHLGDRNRRHLDLEHAVPEGRHGVLSFHVLGIPIRQ
jgi:hypothetical protein